MKNSELQLILYILKNNPITIKKLYCLMYLSQREFLSTFGKRLFDDFFVLSDDFIKPYRLKHYLKDTLKNFKIVNDTIYALTEPDMDYISIKDAEIIDKYVIYCNEKSLEELRAEAKDFAVIKAINRCNQDPDLVRITDVDIAKAGGCDSSLIKYIVENKILMLNLGDD